MDDARFSLAVVTGRYAPALSDDGQRLADALAAYGIESNPVMWDDPTVPWSEYDGVLVRSCWEYPDDRNRFRTMLEELEGAPVQVCNPLEVLQWNLHKTYLTALADAGVRIPPTRVIEQGTAIDLKTVLQEESWTDVVVKPAIGAKSEAVRRVGIDDVDEADPYFADLVAGTDVLVQSFVPEITDGERSMVFFDGEYSHAWNSLPAEHDVTAFDGHDASYEPSARIRDQGAECLAVARDRLGLDEPFTYARIDYVDQNSELLLFELELIEPFLGLERGEGAVDRFSRAVASYFGVPSPGRDA